MNCIKCINHQTQYCLCAFYKLAIEMRLGSCFVVVVKLQVGMRRGNILKNFVQHLTKHVACDYGLAWTVSTSQLILIFTSFFHCILQASFFFFIRASTDDLRLRLSQELLTKVLQKVVTWEGQCNTWRGRAHRSRSHKTLLQMSRSLFDGMTESDIIKWDYKNFLIK